MTSTVPQYMCFVDFETGGVEPHHPSTQFAAIAVDANWQEHETLEVKLQFDESKATPEALAMNHYDREVWKREAVPVATAITRIASFLNRHKSLLKISKKKGTSYYVAKIAGHNVATFDGPRLERLFRDHGMFYCCDYRTRDTLQLAIWWFEQRGLTPPDDTYRLGNLCEYFGIATPEGEQTHSALTDVRLTVALAQKLMSLRNEKI